MDQYGVDFEEQTMGSDIVSLPPVACVVVWISSDLRLDQRRVVASFTETSR
jgi:hypothetical protein